eukprot:jgi/Mesvir1/21699/Mv04118-RA.2
MPPLPAYSCSRELCEGIYLGKLPPYVQYCLHRIQLLVHHGVTPVVVLDGCRLPAKENEEGGRQRWRADNLALARQKAAAGDAEGALLHYQRAVEITAAMASALISALRARSIEYLVAPYEADAQLASLTLLPESQGGIAAVITEDSDLLAYGCPVVLFKMDRYGSAEELRLDSVLGRPLPPAAAVTAATLGTDEDDSGANASQSEPSAGPDGKRKGGKGLSFVRIGTLDKFQAMCVLAGCDFLPQLKGVGIITAHKSMAKYSNVEYGVQYLLRSLKVKPPASYKMDFTRALAVFSHARVYDAQTRGLRFLRPLPAYHRLGTTDLDFLGPDMPEGIPRALAIGHVPFDQVQRLAKAGWPAHLLASALSAAPDTCQGGPGMCPGGRSGPDNERFRPTHHRPHHGHSQATHPGRCATVPAPRSAVLDMFGGGSSKASQPGVGGIKASGSGGGGSIKTATVPQKRLSSHVDGSGHDDDDAVDLSSPMRADPDAGIEHSAATKGTAVHQAKPSQAPPIARRSPAKKAATSATSTANTWTAAKKAAVAGTTGAAAAAAAPAAAATGGGSKPGHGPAMVLMSAFASCYGYGARGCAGGSSSSPEAATVRPDMHKGLPSSPLTRGPAAERAGARRQHVADYGWVAREEEGCDLGREDVGDCVTGRPDDLDEPSSAHPPMTSTHPQQIDGGDHSRDFDGDNQQDHTYGDDDDGDDPARRLQDVSAAGIYRSGQLYPGSHPHLQPQPRPHHHPQQAPPLADPSTGPVLASGTAQQALFSAAKPPCSSSPSPRKLRRLAQQRSDHCAADCYSAPPEQPSGRHDVRGGDIGGIGGDGGRSGGDGGGDGDGATMVEEGGSGLTLRRQLAPSPRKKRATPQLDVTNMAARFTSSAQDLPGDSALQGYHFSTRLQDAAGHHQPCLSGPRNDACQTPIMLATNPFSVPMAYNLDSHRPQPTHSHAGDRSSDPGGDLVADGEEENKWDETVEKYTVTTARAADDVGVTFEELAGSSHTRKVATSGQIIGKPKSRGAPGSTGGARATTKKTATGIKFTGISSIRHYFKPKSG